MTAVAGRVRGLPGRRTFWQRSSPHMLIVLKPDTTPEQQEAVEQHIRSLGYVPHAIPGATRTAIGITGNKGALDPGLFRMMPGVADAIPVSQPFKLVSREVKPDDTVVDIGGVRRSAGRSSSSWPARARSRAASRSSRRPRRCGARARGCCAAARSSRAPRRTSSRA